MASGHTGPKETGEGSKGASRSHQWPEETSSAWWATDAIPLTNSLTGKQAGRTERRVATADGFVAVGCSKPPGNFALALALEVDGRSKLDGIVRLEAPPKFWAQPLAPTHAKRPVRASPGEVRSLSGPNTESETKLHTERQIPATRSLDPTKDLMGWINTGPDELMPDGTVWSDRLAAEEQHTAPSLSSVGQLHT